MGLLSLHSVELPGIGRHFRRLPSARSQHFWVHLRALGLRHGASSKPHFLCHQYPVRKSPLQFDWRVPYPTNRNRRLSPRYNSELLL